MVKLPELNRHIVGLSAIALAIFGLGYGADVINANYERPVARLTNSGGANMQQQQATANNPRWNTAANTSGSNSTSNTSGSNAANTAAGSNSDFFSMLSRIPPNVYGRASGGKDEAAKPQDKAAVSPPASMIDSLAAESKNWNEQDWRLAVQAVTNGRAKNQNTAQNTMSGVVWAPPEEIANKGASSAR